MANALVSFMLQKLDKVYQDYIQQEVTLVVGVEEDVKKLTTTFKVIQAVLNDAERRQIKEEAVKLWLEEFKDIAYDMDDVLDEWSYEKHKSQNDTGEGNNKKKVISSYLCSLCSCFNKVALRHNIGTKIKDIKERLDLVERDQKLNHGFVEIKSDEKPIMRPKTSSFTDVSGIVGRVKDTETIINKLKFLGESSTSTNQPESSSIQALHAPNIISIVGMGGLGKTTLAQRIFDEVKTHFEKPMWVCVSDPFDLVTVTKSIIEEANCEVPNSSEWNEKLQRSLIESLKGKRFLLVLDDVWTDDWSDWEPLEVSLRNGAKGSRILVTTRKERVALMMKATYIHPLEELSDNDCSLLLNRIALEGRNEENHKVLKDIGEEISKKCKGLPLAAKTLGGLLRFKKSKKEWLRVLESEIWELKKVENDCLMPSLLLSYYDLPLPLRGCFAYCSIFPKDHVIEKDLLVKLWMAQDFLNKSRSENDDLEGIGDDYFNNLAMRSFFQDFSKDTNGNIICKMHDLVHDLAQYLTKNECSVKHNNDTQFLDSNSRIRHLTVVCGWNSTVFYDGFKEAKKLRSLQFLNEYRFKIKEVPADLFHRLRCLKVLCLSNIRLENLSGEIENLIHLRYLDLSLNDELVILPDTITNLYNLQTLKLKGCSSLCELPREMRRMINLRHLEISRCDRLGYMPQGIGGLTCLRTLSDFIVGGAIGGCKISELKNLNLLQGGLSIRGLGRVETVNEALEMQMKQKQLHSLTLGFELNDDEMRENRLLSKRMEDVLEVLEPHPDVVELRVDDYLGFKLSRWMELQGDLSILSNVKTLKLFGCINLTKFPAFGQLPSLEVLDIKEAIKVKHIGCEFLYEVDEEEAAGGEILRFNNNNTAAFPKLKSLTLIGSKEMEWEFEGVIAFPILGPCLRELEIGGFRNSKPFVEILSKISSLEILEIHAEATEFIKYIRHDDIDDDDLHTARETILLFPNLKELGLSSMKDMEELKIGFQVMPLLNRLRVSSCYKLKAIQGGSLSKLESLELWGCADLYELGIPNLKSLRLSNPSIHPSLYELVGIPNLKSLRLSKGSIHPSLLEAFGTTLQATLEDLTIVDTTLTCVPEQVQQLTSLKRLELRRCGDELEQRCRKDEGEDWRIISHIPNIRINYEWITARNKFDNSPALKL